MIIYDKKGLTMVVSLMFLTLVTVISVIVVYTWMSNVSVEWNSKYETQASKGKVDILAIRYDESSVVQLGLDNRGSVYHVVDKVMLNQVECPIVSGNVIDDVSLVYVNCSVSIGSSYKIDVVTDKGSYSKSLSVWESTG